MIAESHRNILRARNRLRAPYKSSGHKSTYTRDEVGQKESEASFTSCSAGLWTDHAELPVSNTLLVTRYCPDSSYCTPEEEGLPMLRRLPQRCGVSDKTAELMPTIKQVVN